MNNYKINYNQIGGTNMKCGICGFETGNLQVWEASKKIKSHYLDWGHGGLLPEKLIDISNNRHTFEKSCQLFVKLKLNHPGMKDILKQIRRKASLDGAFNSMENDNDMDYHVSLLQIYINTQHPKFKYFLDNKDDICNQINSYFIEAFREDSFIPGALEKLGDNFIVQKLSISNETFKKYDNAKTNIYKYLNTLFGNSQYTPSQYSPKQEVIKNGYRFFVSPDIDGYEILQPFYWIPDFYFTPKIDESDVKLKNMFKPHISVLNTTQHSKEIQLSDIDSYRIDLPNPITIDNEFNIESSITYNNKIVDTYLDKQTISKEGYWNTLAKLDSYFPLPTIKSLIRRCNT